MSSLVEAERLTKRYKNQLVLDQVSFTVEESLQPDDPAAAGKSVRDHPISVAVS